jgi:hypothetical protein
MSVDAFPQGEELSVHDKVVPDRIEPDDVRGIVFVGSLQLIDAADCSSTFAVQR